MYFNNIFLNQFHIKNDIKQNGAYENRIIGTYRLHDQLFFCVYIRGLKHRALTIFKKGWGEHKVQN